MDLYSYVGNDPVNKNDPTGLCPICLGVVVWALENIAAITTGTIVAAEVASGLPSPASTVESVAARSVATEAEALAQRATEIHRAVPAATQSRTTISVVQTKEGVNVVSSSEARLRPAQRAMLREGEVEARGAGHAEVTAVNGAREMGLNPVAAAASRPICSSCADVLEAQGVQAASALKKKPGE